LYGLFARLPFIIYALLVILYVCVFLAFLQNMEEIELQIKAEKIDIDEIDEPSQPQPQTDHTTAVTVDTSKTHVSAFFGRLSKFSSKQTPVPHQPLQRSSILAFRRLRTYQRFAYPSISGAAGAFSVLFAKCFIRLFQNLINGENVFLHYQTYLVLAGLGASIFFQIRWLNDGLLRFDASYTVPVFTAFWILLSATSGLIFYQEYSTMGTNQMVYFGLGIAITVLCVVSLSRNHSTKREYSYQYQPVRTDTSSAELYDPEDPVQETDSLLVEEKRQLPVLRGTVKRVHEDVAVAAPVPDDSSTTKSEDDQA